MSGQTDAELDDDFVYKRDGFSIPIAAVYGDMPPLDKECFNAYIASREKAAEQRGRVDALSTALWSSKDHIKQLIAEAQLKETPKNGQ